MEGESLDDGRRGGDPADAGAGGEGFGEGVETEDAAGGVEGEVGGEERGKEGRVRLFFGGGCC